jgi:TolB-like protein
MAAKLLNILILFFIINLQGQEEKLKIAVMDFGNTGGLSNEESVTLTNRLRSMLVRTNSLIVLERGKMEEILGEQGFQQTGCTSTECAVEVGKLLNVQKMVSGSIGRIGETYTIDLSLIDVATAAIEQSFISDYKGAIDGLLSEMEGVANQIARRGAALKEEVETFGALQITTDPEKATVILDGTALGESPISLEQIRTGFHRLEVKTGGYAPETKEVEIKKGELTKIQIDLDKIYTLSIKSNPDKADVYIDTRKINVTPFEHDVRENMKLTILLKKENYQDWSKQITVKDNVEIDAKLKMTDAYKRALAQKEQQEKVKKGEGGGNTWLYIGGAAVLAGGAAAAVLLSQKKDKGEEVIIPENVFPNPPDRP